MNVRSLVDVGLHLYPTFATADQYHQIRRGHSPNPRIIAHGLRVDDDAQAWNVAYHRRKDASRLGDVVAYRIDEHVEMTVIQRSLLLLLAEDIPPEALRSKDQKQIVPPLHGALLKNEQDVALFERLLYMNRHNR